MALICAASAQQALTTEVHIVPRVPTKAAPTEKISPLSLQTHTKPMVKDVDLVLLPVTVTDTSNRPVTGMQKTQFQVYEAGTPQYIDHFSMVEAPISLAVILDMSGSMADKFDDARKAIAEFFSTTNPQDEFLTITFADRPELLCDFTNSVETVESQLLYRVAKGQTALLDAIYLGMSKMKHARHPRRALLIISDGGDNHSRYSVSEIKRVVQEADVQIYAIGLYNYVLGTAEEWNGPKLLSSITDMSGGRTFTVSSSMQFSTVAAQISNLLRNQYVLGYKPTNVPRDGKWHKIKIRLLLPKGIPKLLVSAKRGYYSPRERR